MELTDLIQHPELMDRDSLYELRSLVALYPYFQTPRILLLRNLYLLHDPSFDEELRSSAIYVTDRSVLFDLVEGPHYKISRQETGRKEAVGESRMMSLIDGFLESIPVDEGRKGKKGKRKPTPTDASVDYVSYLLECESPDEPMEESEKGEGIKGDKPLGLNDITPREEPDSQANKGREGVNGDPVSDNSEGEVGEGFYTETLARIYIKQGLYEKALEIISRLNDNFPKKNAYFADQIRFLEKLIINNNKKQ